MPAAPSPATILPSCAPEEIGQLKERQALVLADNGKPIIAHLARCIDGKAGRRLKSGPGLEAVVTWLNHEYVWDAAGVIPAVLATALPPGAQDRGSGSPLVRRCAGLGLTSDALEEWHRYSLSLFTERMRIRLRNHCQGR